MPDLNTQMETLTDDQFAQLFGDVPDNTPNANAVLGNTPPKKEPKEAKPKTTKQAPVEQTQEEDEEEVVPELTQEEIEKQVRIALGEDDEDEENQDDEDEDNPKDKNKNKLDKDSSASILQTQAQMLIESGVWQEFEGMEEFEWTNENYAKLVEQQNEWILEDRMSELLDATGPYGKAIISHIQNGGNPEDIIDLFKEAKKIESFDISTEEGKTSLLTKYYKDLGWKDARIKRTIDAAIDSGSLDEDVQEAKEEMEAAIQEEVAAKQKAQEDYLRQQREASEKFSSNITNILRERKDLSQEQKRDIASSLLVYDKKLPDGRIVNQFTLDFAKLQSDPNKYVDLVMFVKDYDKFVEKLSKQEEKKANKKAWDFVKGNGATNKTIGAGSHTKGTNKDKSDLVIDYRQFNY